MIERAIVLAAGFGKRVLPLTNTTPKPLLKINNVSLLENTLNFLKKLEDLGVTRIIYTDINRDGTKSGVDYNKLKKIK